MARKMKVREGDLEVEFDEQKAIESYRKIRAGSLKGAAMTKRAFQIIRDNPELKERLWHKQEHEEEQPEREERSERRPVRH